MATKLKNYSRQWYVKLTAYILILMMAMGFIRAGFMMMNVEYRDSMQSEKYVDSYELSYDMQRIADNLMVMKYAYQSRDNILAGNTINLNDLYKSIYYNEYSSYIDRLENTIYNQYEYDQYEYNAYNSRGESVQQNTSTSPTKDSDTAAKEQEVNQYRYSSDYYDEYYKVTDNKFFVDFLSKNPSIVEKAKKEYINSDLKNFSEIEKYLNSVKGFVYSIDSADSLEKFEKYPAYGVLNTLTGQVEYFGGRYADTMYGSSYDYTDKIQSGDFLGVAIEQEHLKAIQKQWTKDREVMIESVVLMAICIVIALILFLYLIIVTGKSPYDDEVHLVAIDRIFTEIHLGILFCLVLFGSVGMSYIGLDQNFSYVTITTIGTGCIAIGLPIVLSILRNIKAKRFIRSFAIGIVLIKIWSKISNYFNNVVKNIWNGTSLMKKCVGTVILVCFLSATWLMLPIILVVSLWFTPKFVKQFETIRDGVKKVKDGDIDYKIKIEGKNELSELAKDINDISEGLTNAIDSKIKSEKLKSELISNVSHDIKTPLTSIITYVDLLKKEDVENSKAEEYIRVIDAKSQRLKMLTADLFEAAKATSGDINVNLEKIDITSLIRQGLGEFSEQIAKCDLDFRVNMPSQPVYMKADGRLIWRVLENLLSNTIKYSQPSTRVYIDVEENNNNIVLFVKNISQYELNMPAEELLERSTRGDSSRNSEGSGLGLNIANSLVELQNGELTLDIDGDLFKVTVIMPKY